VVLEIGTTPQLLMQPKTLSTSEVRAVRLRNSKTNASALSA
jgi:hypothetical protein